MKLLFTLALNTALLNWYLNLLNCQLPHLVNLYSSVLQCMNAVAFGRPGV